jgi:DNA polymerase
MLSADRHHANDSTVSRRQSHRLSLAEMASLNGGWRCVAGRKTPGCLADLEGMDKAERYRVLIDQRKRCASCPMLTNASSIDGGRHDANEIGAYSRWQGNLDAELMVIGQDFADIDGFRKHRGWAGERVRLFFTNAVLCMKSGGMQASIPGSCFRQCGSRFLRPLVELVSPRVVATLGQNAMQAVCGAFGLVSKGKLRDVVAQPIPLTGGTMLMPLYHPSRTVLNTARSLETQREDWRNVGRVLSGAGTSTPGTHETAPHDIAKEGSAEGPHHQSRSYRLAQLARV